MRITLSQPSELGSAEIAQWHSMLRTTPSLANPFLSPEFAMAVGRFRPDARVAVLSDGPSITGFFPFERRQLSLGVPIGGWLSPCQGIIYAPGAHWDSREFLKGCRLSAWKFDNLIADQPLSLHQTAMEPSPVIDLVDGFDSYYAKLRVKAPRFCRELDRKARKLDREIGELRVVADERDSQMLHTLMAWKSEQYRRTSHVDRFERPWLTGLLETLMAARGDHLSGLLSVLYAGGQPVAAQFGLRTGNLLVGWFTGYDIRFRRYSPGLIHLRHMTEELAVAGVQAIHMGKGAKGYTETLKSHDVFLGEGVLTGQSMLGAAHRIRNASARWAVQTVRQHPFIHQTADRTLRLSGVSRRMYGRILSCNFRPDSMRAGCVTA